MALVSKQEVFVVQMPSGAYFYKMKNGQEIWKNKYVNEYYITYPSHNSGKHIVEHYTGECTC